MRCRMELESLKVGLMECENKILIIFHRKVSQTRISIETRHSSFSIIHQTCSFPFFDKCTTEEALKYFFFSSISICVPVGEWAKSATPTTMTREGLKLSTPKHSDEKWREQKKTWKSVRGRNLHFSNIVQEHWMWNWNITWPRLCQLFKFNSNHEN